MNPQVLVGLAHAAVQAEALKKGKKHAKPADLEQGAETLKAVFSYVGRFLL